MTYIIRNYPQSQAERTIDTEGFLFYTGRINVFKKLFYFYIEKKYSQSLSIKDPLFISIL
jgi:hypothetical protein